MRTATEKQERVEAVQERLLHGKCPSSPDGRHTWDVMKTLEYSRVEWCVACVNDPSSDIPRRMMRKTLVVGKGGPEVVWVEDVGK